MTLSVENKLQIPRVSSTSSLAPVNKALINEQVAKEWKKCFFKTSSKILSPCYDRLSVLAEKNEPSVFSRFTLKNIEGAFPRLTNLEANCKIKLQISLFDMEYRSFYGRTWHGPLKALKRSHGRTSLNYDENTYFHSSMRDSHVLIVLEAVAILNDGKKKSCGWTAFRPFVQTSKSNAAVVTQRLGFYHGTPRALLYMDEPWEKNEILKAITGCYVSYTFTTLPKVPERIKLLVPENVIVGAYDKICGIIDTDTDPLERPRFIMPNPAIIEELYITLNPNIHKFETELCNLIAEDKSYWERVTVDPKMIVISERRLRISVHNGWNYTHEPYVVQLGVESEKAKKNVPQPFNKRLSFRGSSKVVKGDEKVVEGDATRLVMRNSVVLNDLFEDPASAIVFVIEYIINVPVNLQVLNLEDKRRNTVDSKKQFETTNLIVRWAAWSPFLSNNPEMENIIEINMYGGNRISNPERALVFKIPDTQMQDEFSAKSAPGKITFQFKKGGQLNFKPQLDNYVNHGDARPPSAQLSDRRSYKGDQPDNNTVRPKMQDLVSQLSAKQNTMMSIPTNMSASQAFTDTQRMMGMFKGNLELYPLPNQPAHHPILPLEPGQMGGRTISRAAYAKLQNAKFPQILDRSGKPAEVVDESSYITFDLNKEDSDALVCNEIYFQFLAFSRIFTSSRNAYPQKPHNVFFTFQFYRFPEIKTPRLHLDDLIEDYSVDPNCVPFILKYIEKEAGTSKAKPGYMIKYNVDPTVLKFGEKLLFLKYLAYETVFIDVWDGDSLHLIGTCTLELKQLLRQGNEAVQATYELDVLSTEYDDETIANSAHTLKEGTPYDFSSHIKLQGKLHIRIGNVGFPFDEAHKNTEMLTEMNPPPPIPLSRIVASKTTLSNTGDKLLSRKLDEMSSKGFLTHNLAKANHMTETFKEIHTALATDPNLSRGHSNDLPNDPLRKRKLNRMQLVRRLEENQTMPPEILGGHRRLIEERSKDLRIMDFYRKQTKHDQILNKLHDFATTEHVIYPTFGSVEFLEFVITNPYNEPQTITIITGDMEASVVTDVQEWRHLKMLHHMYGEVEENMFHREQTDMNGIKFPQLFLRPKETVHVPIKFQTFKASNAVENENKQHPAQFNNNEKSYSQLGNVTHKIYQPRKCPIEFRAQDGNPIAILLLIVEQQPHLINQTFRFNVPEHTFLKKTIRLPSSVSAMAVNSTSLLGSNIKFSGTGENGLSRLYIRSSDQTVICESKAVSFGEPHDVFVKSPCPASPNVKKFHLAIYADQFLSIPLQIWQVYVHALQRVDISTIQGQTSRFSVILKGTQSSRYAQIYPSVPEEMAVVPNDKFMLSASAVQEINVAIRPQNSGYKHYYLNVVDIEMHQLIHSWYIYIHSKPPIISKAFELTLPVATSVNSSNTTSKRVTYTNPYATEKIFLISTNREDLLTFKETRIKFAANETKTLALKFLPNTKPGFIEILVFINNENDTNEETFAIRGTYVHSLEASTSYE